MQEKEFLCQYRVEEEEEWEQEQEVAPAVAVETMLVNNNNISINLQGQVEVVIVTNLEIVTKSEDDNGNFNLAYDNQPTFSEAMRATDVVDDDVVSKRLGCLNIVSSNLCLFTFLVRLLIHQMATGLKPQRYWSNSNM